MNLTTISKTLAAVGLAATASAATGAPIIFNGSGTNPANGTALSASASFEVLSGGILRIILTNTAGSDVNAPSDVLTGLFFSIPVALAPQSDVISSGSAFFYGSSPNNAAGEWTYKFGPMPGGANSGISATGLGGIFGPPNAFPGGDLGGGNGPGGVDWGILSAGDNLLSANGGVSGGGPLARNSMTFTLALPGAVTNLAPLSITNVAFQYGTATNEPRFPGCAAGGTCGDTSVPEPASLALLGIGLGAVCLGRRRRT